MARTVSQTTIEVDGVKIFYKYAGDKSKPVILLLHGFPSSSHMFRNLIPLLAEDYHVVAPDLPGFGFTVVPDSRKYQYNFENLTTTIEAFVDAVGLKRFAIYVFDYGAPTGFRLALRRPDAITAIITQNGNAYKEGLGPFWEPLQKYWASGQAEDREALRQFFTIEATRSQYVDGSPHPERISPETWTLDQATALDRPGGHEIQLNLFADYASNVALYPRFHEYFRSSGVPVLAVWGRNDSIFVPPGAEAFARDVQRFELHFLDASHFALETNEEEMAVLINGFLKKNVV
ncbi:Alpha/Beta hydrolase protein [Paramyrothecium foliicola]|nr:Alpha/Beta hydrolase protein [Paramyrothecium foliicola]